MSVDLSKMPGGVGSYIRNFISYRYNRVTNDAAYLGYIPSFTKYFEVEGDKNRDEWEIPVFMYEGFDLPEIAHDKTVKLILPVYHRRVYWYSNDFGIPTATTLNTFCNRMSSTSLSKVSFKNRVYRGCNGALFDSDDNLLMLSTVKNGEVSVYVSVNVLYNLNNTIEKAIMQKFVPAFVDSGCEIKITEKIPFLKTVKNRIGNTYFTESCYDTIKENISSYQILA